MHAMIRGHAVQIRSASSKEETRTQPGTGQGEPTELPIMPCTTVFILASLCVSGVAGWSEWTSVPGGEWSRSRPRGTRAGRRVRERKASASVAMTEAIKTTRLTCFGHS